MPSLTVDQWLLSFILAALVVIIALGIASLAMGADGEAPGWMKRIRLEPVRVGSAIVALLAVAGSFGLSVSDLQQGAIVGAVIAVLAIFSESVRAKVTPVAALEPDAPAEKSKA